MSQLVNPPTYRNDTVLPLPPEVQCPSWAVDAACLAIQDQWSINVLTYRQENKYSILVQ